jgi:uncharacterized protein (DUF1330 family)
MAKGYWIVHVDVTDPEAYKAYIAANGPVFAKFGARFLARAGRYETLEGTSRGRNVVIEFPSYEAALGCWRSPEYQEVMKLRQHAGIADLVVIEGYEGAQPTLASGAALVIGAGLLFLALAVGNADAKSLTTAGPRWSQPLTQSNFTAGRPRHQRRSGPCRVPIETQSEKTQASMARRLCSNRTMEERPEGTAGSAQ